VVANGGRVALGAVQPAAQRQLDTGTMRKPAWSSGGEGCEAESHAVGKRQLRRFELIDHEQRAVEIVDRE
jgi:hypothetical protein